jgi:hypothetical protein
MKRIATPLILTILAVSWLNVGPAWGHADGGRAQLYVAAAQLRPAPQGWSLTVDLRDLDSGQPEPGFAVQVKGAGPNGASFGPVSLTDTRNDGHYEVHVPLTPGQWALTVEADEVPGGNPALPYSHTWQVSPRPGEPSSVVGRGGEHRHSSGSSGRGSTPALLGIAIAGAAGLAAFGVRRVLTVDRGAPV